MAQLQLVPFVTGAYQGFVEQFAPWIERGIPHGFFGVIRGFSTLSDAEKSETTHLLWPTPLYLLQQVL